MGKSPHSSGSLAWHRALQEADSALVCLQAGCVQQAVAHLMRGEAALAGEVADDPPLESVQGTPSWRDRLEAQRRLRALTRALVHDPGHAEATPQAPPDRLNRQGRIKALAGSLGIIALVLLFRPDTPPPEERSAGGTLPEASSASRVITYKELMAHFPNTTFSHLMPGVRFGKQVEVRLSKATPVYQLNIILRNAMIHRVILKHGEVVKHSFLLGPRAIPVGMLEYDVDLRKSRAPHGVDTIVVQGVDGDGAFKLGPIRIKDWD